MTEHTNLFACGCGQQFSQKSDFRDHSLGSHQAIFVKGSSHFLTVITSIVVPVVTQKLQSNIDKRYNAVSNHTRSINELSISKVQIQADEKEVSSSEQTVIKKIGRIKKNNKKGQIQDNQKDQMVDLHQAKDFSGSVEVYEKRIIEWNGFKLIPNFTCNTCPFYCGTCNLIFSYPDQFVQHCIQVCQELNNLLSSHFIANIFDTQSQTPEIHQQEQAISKTFLDSAPVVQKKNESDICKNLQASLVQGCSGLVELFKQEEIQTDGLMPRCGICEKKYSIRGYKTHVVRSHSQIITESSSHVIIRRCSHNDHQIRQILMRVNANEDGNSIWKCPCKQDTEMCRQVFIKHLLQVHKGISLIYHWNNAA